MEEERTRKIDKMIQNMMSSVVPVEFEDVFIVTSVLGILFGDLSLGENYSNIANQINKLFIRSNHKVNFEEEVLSFVKRYVQVIYEAQQKLVDAMKENIKKEQQSDKKNTNG